MIDRLRARARRTISGVVVGLLLAGASPAAAQSASEWPIVELRQYTLKAGQRDTLISLFESEFIETQEVAGMRIFGTFRDLDRPDRFVWIRAFRDMPSRAESLTAFYSGPVWKAHGKAAAATMIDASNVLLLRDARPGSGFSLSGVRPPKGAREETPTLIVANIYYFRKTVDRAFIDFFEQSAVPALAAAGIPVLGSFVTETAANNYPQLPVRADERVLVWFARFADRADHERRMAGLMNASGWKPVAEKLRIELTSPPEVLLLQPTPRSQLRE